MKREKKIQRLQKIQGIGSAPKASVDAAKKAGEPQADFVDGISENFDKFEVWFIENGKIILTVCIVILAAVAAFYTIKYVNEKNKAAVTALYANADTTEKLAEVLQKNPSAPEALSASLTVAAEYAAKKQYDKALAVYTKVSNESSDEFIARRASLNVAAINEVLGKKDVAVALYSRIADDLKAPEALRAEAAYGAGRLYYSAKNTVAARKYLSLFVNTANQEAGQWAALSRALLNRIPAPAVKVSAVPADKNVQVKKTPAPVQKAPVKK